MSSLWGDSGSSSSADCLQVRVGPPLEWASQDGEGVEGTSVEYWTSQLEVLKETLEGILRAPNAPPVVIKGPEGGTTPVQVKWVVFYPIHDPDMLQLVYGGVLIATLKAGGAVFMMPPTGTAAVDEHLGKLMSAVSKFYHSSYSHNKKPAGDDVGSPRGTEFSESSFASSPRSIAHISPTTATPPNETGGGSRGGTALPFRSSLRKESLSMGSVTRESTGSLFRSSSRASSTESSPRRFKNFFGGGSKAAGGQGTASSGWSARKDERPSTADAASKGDNPPGFKEKWSAPRPPRTWDEESTATTTLTETNTAEWPGGRGLPGISEGGPTPSEGGYGYKDDDVQSSFLGSELATYQGPMGGMGGMGGRPPPPPSDDGSALSLSIRPYSAPARDEGRRDRGGEGSPIPGRRGGLESPGVGRRARRALESPGMGRRERGDMAESPVPGRRGGVGESPSIRTRRSELEEGRRERGLESPVVGRRDRSVESPIVGRRDRSLESPIVGRRERSVESPGVGRRERGLDSPVVGRRDRSVESPSAGRRERGERGLESPGLGRRERSVDSPGPRRGGVMDSPSDRRAAREREREERERERMERDKERAERERERGERGDRERERVERERERGERGSWRDRESPLSARRRFGLGSPGSATRRWGRERERDRDREPGSAGRRDRAYSRQEDEERGRERGAGYHDKYGSYREEDSRPSTAGASVGGALDAGLTARYNATVGGTGVRASGSLDSTGWSSQASGKEYSRSRPESSGGYYAPSSASEQSLQRAGSLDVPVAAGPQGQKDAWAQHPLQGHQGSSSVAQSLPATAPGSPQKRQSTRAVPHPTSMSLQASPAQHGGAKGAAAAKAAAAARAASAAKAAAEAAARAAEQAAADAHAEAAEEALAEAEAAADVAVRARAAAEAEAAVQAEAVLRARATAEAEAAARAKMVAEAERARARAAAEAEAAAKARLEAEEAARVKAAAEAEAAARAKAAAEAEAAAAAAKSKAEADAARVKAEAEEAARQAREEAEARLKDEEEAARKKRESEERSKMAAGLGGVAAQLESEAAALAEAAARAEEAAKAKETDGEWDKMSTFSARFSAFSATPKYNKDTKSRRRWSRPARTTPAIPDHTSDSEEEGEGKGKAPVVPEEAETEMEDVVAPLGSLPLPRPPPMTVPTTLRTSLAPSVAATPRAPSPRTPFPKEGETPMGGGGASPQAPGTPFEVAEWSRGAFAEMWRLWQVSRGSITMEKCLEVRVGPPPVLTRGPMGNEDPVQYWVEQLEQLKARLEAILNEGKEGACTCVEGGPAAAPKLSKRERLVGTLSFGLFTIRFNAGSKAKKVVPCQRALCRNSNHKWSLVRTVAMSPHGAMGTMIVVCGGEVIAAFEDGRADYLPPTGDRALDQHMGKVVLAVSQFYFSSYFKA